MRVAADASDTFESKIEWLGLETRFLKEGNKERSKATVYVKR
jgi:hypothetical protein